MARYRYEHLSAPRPQRVKWTFAGRRRLSPTSSGNQWHAEEEEVKSFCSGFLWIGWIEVYNVVVVAAEAITNILAQACFPKIEVPSVSLAVLPELLKPFTLTFGFSVATLRTPNYEGTGSLYLRHSNATSAPSSSPPPTSSSSRVH
ncbi:hypothetical protein GSI_13909 [Ganoderma sinense ZZ0214-1]|uniref:Uncharacterized protein n=1 Tax=Ganoderma sinense ZZ0214-1 TaxID=1077348 RepID=A0A2G8RRL8_9APHY|nr:hypothetical protein GSI_13909 [Ganoderma sinense ZZ0214-1]